MPEASEIQSRFQGRLSLLNALGAILEEKTIEALQGLAHIDRIGFRAKSATSFAKKAADPKYTAPLTQIEDQVAGRVITFFRDDILRVRDRVTEYFGDVEHQTKEPAGPSEFGYESDHFIFVIPEHCKPQGWADEAEMPHTFEFQIRTLFMHAWAEPQHDIGYKGELDETSQRELAWIAASAWGADHKLNEIASRLASSG